MYLVIVVAVPVVCSSLVLSVSPTRITSMMVLEMLLAVRVPVGNATVAIEVVPAVLRAFNPVLLVLVCHGSVMMVAIVIVVARLLLLLLLCGS